MKTAFYAYDSSSTNARESIRGLASRITDTHQFVFTLWEQLGRSNFVIRELLRSIDDCDIFCADCSTLNANVLFELGYAIARQKRIFISLDTSMPVASTRYQSFNLLSPVRYFSSQHEDSLMDAFKNCKYYEDDAPTLYSQLVQPHLTGSTEENILFLKPRAETNAIRKITRLLNNYSSSHNLSVRIDDSTEVLQPLSWYITEIQNSVGALCLFCSDELLDNDITNPRYGLLSGIIHGLNKSLLMVANSSYYVPFDYTTLLRVYQDANQAQAIVSDWIEPIVQQLTEVSRIRQENLTRIKSSTELRDVWFGQVVAELEQDDLVDKYFVETTTYRDALSGRCNIFIGRRGVGKTATLYKLQKDLSHDLKNFVCLIKPESYELQGILRIIEDFGGLDTSGFALQSLWKYLLLTEIAVQIYRDIQQKEAYIRTEQENELVSYISEHERILKGDFATRLEDAVNEIIKTKGQGKTLLDWKESISERLHSGPIKQLNDCLKGVLSTKHRVAVLIDNLDKAWEIDSSLDQLSQFVLALLTVASDIHNLFNRKTINELSCKLSVTLFLRSDIFHRVRQRAREADKINYRKVEWSDRELLLRIVEERYEHSSSEKHAGSELWDRVFEDGQSAKKSILEHIYMRPRDLLQCIKTAVEVASDRRQPKVRLEDLIEAFHRYSRFALGSIQSESKIANIDIDSIVTQFIQCAPVLTHSRVSTMLREAGVDNDSILITIRELCLVGFLGLVVGENRIEYIDDVDNYDRIRMLANLYASKAPRKEVKYAVRKAFWPFLEIGCYRND